MRYLTVDQVLEINRTAVGDRSTLRDYGLLDSAVMRPQQSVFGEVDLPHVAGHLGLEQGEAVRLAVDTAEGHLDADELALLLKGRATEITLLFDSDEG